MTRFVCDISRTDVNGPPIKTKTHKALLDALKWIMDNTGPGQHGYICSEIRHKGKYYAYQDWWYIDGVLKVSRNPDIADVDHWRVVTL